MDDEEDFRAIDSSNDESDRLSEQHLQSAPPPGLVPRLVQGRDAHGPPAGHRAIDERNSGSHVDSIAAAQRKRREAPSFRLHRGLHSATTPLNEILYKGDIRTNSSGTGEAMPPGGSSERLMHSSVSLHDFEDDFGVRPLDDDDDDDDDTDSAKESDFGHGRLDNRVSGGVKPTTPQNWREKSDIAFSQAWPRNMDSGQTRNWSAVNVSRSRMQTPPTPAYIFSESHAFSSRRSSGPATPDATLAGFDSGTDPDSARRSTDNGVIQGHSESPTVHLTDETMTGFAAPVSSTTGRRSRPVDYQTSPPVPFRDMRNSNSVNLRTSPQRARVHQAWPEHGLQYDNLLLSCISLLEQVSVGVATFHASASNSSSNLQVAGGSKKSPNANRMMIDILRKLDVFIERLRESLNEERASTLLSAHPLLMEFDEFRLFFSAIQHTLPFELSPFVLHLGTILARLDQANRLRRTVPKSQPSHSAVYGRTANRASAWNAPSASGVAAPGSSQLAGSGAIGGFTDRNVSQVRGVHQMRLRSNTAAGAGSSKLQDLEIFQAKQSQSASDASSAYSLSSRTSPGSSPRGISKMEAKGSKIRDLSSPDLKSRKDSEVLSARGSVTGSLDTFSRTSPHSWRPVALADEGPTVGEEGAQTSRSRENMDVSPRKLVLEGRTLAPSYFDDDPERAVLSDDDIDDKHRRDGSGSARSRHGGIYSVSQSRHESWNRGRVQTISVDSPSASSMPEDYSPDSAAARVGFASTGSPDHTPLFSESATGEAIIKPGGFYSKQTRSSDLGNTPVRQLTPQSSQAQRRTLLQEDSEESEDSKTPPRQVRNSVRGSPCNVASEARETSSSAASSATVPASPVSTTDVLRGTSAADVTHCCICRICERYFHPEIFEVHSLVCGSAARALQMLLSRNGAMLRLANGIERFATRRKADNKYRTEKELETLQTVQTYCYLPNSNAAQLEDLLDESARKLLHNDKHLLSGIILPGLYLSRSTLSKYAKALKKLSGKSEKMEDPDAARIAVQASEYVMEMDEALHTLLQCKDIVPESMRSCISLDCEGTSESEPWCDRLKSILSYLVFTCCMVDQSRDLSIVTAGDRYRGGALSSATSCPEFRDFKVLKPISRGAFGRVYLARKKKTNDLFALKVLEKKHMLDKNMADRVLTERTILSEVSDAFIVRFYWSFQSQNRLYFALEFVPGGDMYSLLCNLGFLDESIAKRYIAETVHAVDYLHKLGIVHGDLKPDNLLIARHGHIKLTDFGLSKYHTEQGMEPSTTESQKRIVVRDPLGNTQFSHRIKAGHETMASGNLVGTPDYLAPELLLGTSAGFSVDWWALGVILYEFLMGIPPFHDASPENIFENILSSNVEWPAVPDEMSAEACDLIQRLLDRNPETRIGSKGAHEIRQHPFFDGVQWNDLFNQKAFFVPDTIAEEDTSYFTSRNPMEALSFDAEYNPNDLEKKIQDVLDQLKAKEGEEAARADMLSPRARMAGPNSPVGPVSGGGSLAGGEVLSPSRLSKSQLQPRLKGISPAPPAVKGVNEFGVGGRIDSMIIERTKLNVRNIYVSRAEKKAMEKARRETQLIHASSAHDQEVLAESADPFTSFSFQNILNLQSLNKATKET
ncbi:putative serine/threonine protein kinase IRE4 [Porphyridium purpureum]|uniref:non-specific serine/threonine protein kinase n=1 Tax=Porphyridium purpureum TaxID=35688 RepID=A0A5J4Z682_PORPP|nr:putative serine/threonine protein kinase IRE4 [Porphyridium purpureum]|eukprot:POR7681..scf295_1